MTLPIRDLFDDIPARLPEELFSALAGGQGVKIERIVSAGHFTAPGEWYDQESAEWVMVLQGVAKLQFEGEVSERILRPYKYVLIPPHRRHRVTFTTRKPPCIWLAVHFHPEGGTAEGA